VIIIIIIIIIFICSEQNINDIVFKAVFSLYFADVDEI